MAIKIGISGFGRISRVVIRAAMFEDDIEIAGINVRNADLEYMVYMLKYDSAHGRFHGQLEEKDGKLIANGHEVIICDRFFETDSVKDVLKKHNPDIIGIQELDYNTRRTNNTNQLEQLAKVSGYKYFYYSKMKGKTP